MQGVSIYATLSQPHDQKNAKKIKPTAKEVEQQRRNLGPCTRFGEGDGSFWDRWLIAAPPLDSPTLGNGTIMPQRGFKKLNPKRFSMPHKLATVDTYKKEGYRCKSLEDLVREDAELMKIKSDRAIHATLNNGRTNDYDGLDPREPLKPPASRNGRRQCQTQKARDAVERFNLMVDQSIQDLKKQCILKTPTMRPKFSMHSKTRARPAPKHSKRMNTLQMIQSIHSLEKHGKSY